MKWSFGNGVDDEWKSGRKEVQISHTWKNCNNIYIYIYKNLILLLHGNIQYEMLSLEEKEKKSSLCCTKALSSLK